MIIIGSIISFITGICIYMFYRAEGLQSKLNLVHKEIRTTNKTNQNLIDTMAIIALKNQEFAVNRLETLKEQDLALSETLTIIMPFIQSYSIIIKDIIKGSGQLNAVVKKLYDGADKNAYKRFTSFVSNQDASIKRLWSTNNLVSYISMVEALLVLLEEQRMNIEVENKKAS